MINRIKEFIENENISIRAFEQKIGASNGLIRKAIANETDIQSKWISAIVENYPQINPEWLLTGRGEMLVSKEPVPDYNRPKITPSIASGVTATYGVGPQVPASDKRNEDLIEVIKEQQKIIAAQQHTISEMVGTINILAKRGDADTVTGVASRAASE